MLLGFVQVSLLFWIPCKFNSGTILEFGCFMNSLQSNKKMKNFVALAINLSDNYIVFDLDALKNFCTLQALRQDAALVRSLLLSLGFKPRH